MDWLIHNPIGEMYGPHFLLLYGGVIAVTYTRARFVTKPKGAKPGTVQVRKEKVLKVRPSIDGVECLPED